VLIEGATGSGKELIAKAIHRLSARAGKPYVVLNCAAIPSRCSKPNSSATPAEPSPARPVPHRPRRGRRRSTLFLDEIGEMPLALQAKMLRFLESGEIQRVGGNETVQVDVRIVAATISR